MASYNDFEEMWSDSQESAEDYVGPAIGSRTRRLWLEQHFDVLQELYRAFKLSGESVFGLAFFQYGNFYHFVNLIYENTLDDDADLLKAKIAETHVGALGLGARSKHRLPNLQKAKNNGPDGISGEAIRGSWSNAVGANAAGRSEFQRD